jgi:hypothetical protein
MTKARDFFRAFFLVPQPRQIRALNQTLEVCGDCANIVSRPHDGVPSRFMQIRIVVHTLAGAALTIFVVGVVWAIIYRPW